MVELLPVTVWTFQVTRCILWSRCCLTMMQFFQMTVRPNTQPESVQSRYEQHEDALQHLPWPAQLPDLNMWWSVLDSRVISRSPPASSLQQPDVLEEQLHSILLQTVQNLYQSVQNLYQSVQNLYRSVQNWYQSVQNFYKTVQNLYQSVQNLYQSVQHLYRSVPRRIQAASGK